MKDILKYMIAEDVGFEDITTKALVNNTLIAKANIISRQTAIVAGVELISEILDEYFLDYTIYKNDGEIVNENEVILSIEGSASDILTLERTMLNLMIRLSGIATLTKNVIDMAREVNEDVIIAATRKTTPGIQSFEMNAVRLAGGDTHRFRLDDCVLIKDNHLEIIGDITQAIQLAKKHVSFTKKIEIEVENKQDALTASKAGADIILLDNMSPTQIQETLKLLKSNNLRDNVLIEASGGINPDNIRGYAETGVDIISLGFLSHSAQSVDLSLEMIF